MDGSNILTIDFGTQSVRVAIFNDKGEELSMEKTKQGKLFSHF